MSRGLDTTKVAPVASDRHDARTVQRITDAFDSLVSIAGEDFVRRLHENTIGNPDTVECRGLRVTHADLRLIFNAWRLDQVLPRTTDRIFINEIGGGYGGLAAKLKRLRANSVIVLFDLPEVNALQSYYLSQSHPDARLYTLESHRANKLGDLLAGAYDFAVLPGWCMAEFPDCFCDCAVNLRSMMEMNLETVRFYFSEIQRTVRPGGSFYCANRYRKTTTGETNRIKDYPFDKYWMATSSEAAWDQPWVHEIVAVRQAVPNAFPLAMALQDLPPWTAAEVLYGAARWLERLWRLVRGSHPSIMPGLPGLARNWRIMTERRLVAEIRRYPRIHRLLRRLG